MDWLLRVAERLVALQLLSPMKSWRSWVGRFTHFLLQCIFVKFVVFVDSFSLARPIKSNYDINIAINIPAFVFWQPDNKMFIPNFCWFQRIRYRDQHWLFSYINNWDKQFRWLTVSAESVIHQFCLSQCQYFCFWYPLKEDSPDWMVRDALLSVDCWREFAPTTRW